MSRTVIYEHPLNERIRNLLRLEFLFRQMKHQMAGTTPWDSRAAIAALLEVLTLLSRSDLKGELIKELERSTATLAPLAGRSGVDDEQLGNILHWLERLHKALHAADGQLGQALRDDEFLSAVRQRSTIPGGTCDFDLPGYHHWLHRGAEERHQQQEAWLVKLEPVRKSVELLLKLIRGSADPVPQVAEAGFYPCALEQNVPYQLVRVLLPGECPFFPEISGGKHRFTIRFMVASTSRRPVQTGEDVEFRLIQCAL